MLQGRQKVLVEWLGLDIAGLARAHLLHESLALHPRIVQLGERVGNFDTASERLEAFDLIGIVRFAFGQGGARKVGRIVRQESGLDELGLSSSRILPRFQLVSVCSPARSAACRRDSVSA